MTRKGWGEIQSHSSAAWKEVTETIDPDSSQRWTAKSHEAMDMSWIEENPDQIQRIKSSQWEWCSPGMRTQSVWGIYTLEDFHSSVGQGSAWHSAMLGAVGAAVGILFSVTFPTTPDSFLPNTTPHFPDTSCFHGLCRGSVFWCTATHRYSLCFC